MTNSHIELPALESVTVRTTPGFIAMVLHFVIILALLGAAAFLILVVKSATVPMDVVLIFSVLLLTGVLGLWLIDAPFFDSGWATDAGGLTISRTWKPRRILWSQVTSAEIRWASLILGRRYIITTQAGSLFVPTTYPDLVASVWLHLNRVGKASGLKLENDAESLLAPIDATAPTEVQWVSSCPPSIARLLIEITVVVLLHWLGNQVLATIFAAAVAAIESPRLSTARSVAIGADGFRAETIFGDTVARWIDVKSAQWNPSHTGIVLKVSRMKHINIPWYRDDEDSHALIAAIAMHLRNRRPQLLLTIPCHAEEE